MKTESITRTVEELIEIEKKGGPESPLPLEVIPNYMGINLVAVKSLTWTRREDGQLVDLTIHFIPEEA